MNAGALRFGAGAAFAALILLSMRPPMERCWPLDNNPGAWACVGAARPPGGAKAAELAPSGGRASDALTDDFRQAVLRAAEYVAPEDRAPTPNPRTPLPTWLPAGVLRWEAEIHEAAGRVNLDPLALAILVSIECPSGNPLCSSHIVPPAVGLSQFMSGTAAAVAQRSGLPCENRTDPVTSLRCGAYHLVELMRMCSALWSEGREANALACAGTGYSAGPGYIPAMRAHVQAGGDPRTAPIPAETRRWVTSALEMWRKAGRQ